MMKEFLKDVVKYMPSRVVPGIIGFISIPIFTRLFPPSEYGYYSLVMATIVILSTLLGWVSFAIIRFYAACERDEKLESFSADVVRLTLISIIIIDGVFLVLLLLAKDHVSFDLYSLMQIGVVVFSLNAVFGVLQAFLMCKRAVNWYSAFSVWNSMASLGFALVLVCFFDRGIESLLWGPIICLIIALPLLWKKSFAHLVDLRSKLDLSLAREMARYSIPLVVGNLAAWILSLSDRYILQYFRGTYELGVYSASYNITDRSIMLIVSLFTMAAAPITVRIWENQGEAASKVFLNKMTRYLLMIAVPAVVGLIVLRSQVVALMTSEKYYEGYKAIPFVAPGILFLGLQQIFHAGFRFHKKTAAITYATVASGLVNIMLNFLFIPKYGYLAAAITTLISYILLLFLIVTLSRRLFVWEFPFMSLRNVVISSAIMGGVVYSFVNILAFDQPISLIFAVMIGVVCYSLILALLGEFLHEEIEWLRCIIRR